MKYIAIKTRMNIQSSFIFILCFTLRKYRMQYIKNKHIYDVHEHRFQCKYSLAIFFFNVTSTDANRYTLYNIVYTLYYYCFMRSMFLPLVIEMTKVNNQPFNGLPITEKWLAYAEIRCTFPHAMPIYYIYCIYS